MPEASSHVGTPPEIAEARADAWSLTPDEATAVLEAYAGEFHQPAPITPENAHDADRRLTELINNPEWARKLMNGDIATRQEFQRLTELKANATAAEAIAGATPQVMGTTIGAEELTRADTISAAEHLRSIWGPESDGAIAELLDPNLAFPADFVAGAQAWKAQAMNDPAFVEMLMRGDQWATQRMLLANAAIAIGTGKGP
jgi:hypothetical protein